MSTTSVSISERIALVRAEIVAACQRAGRPSDSVTLIAVSKTHPVPHVVEAIQAGALHFGENRIEEALPKMAGVAQWVDSPIYWHMIGTVQSRKARYILSGFCMLHSLGEVKLAERLSQAFVEQGRTLDVLLEMNVSGEATKQGWQASRWRDDPAVRQAVWAAVAHILALPGIKVRGLMTMAPIVDNLEAARPVFSALRELRDALANDFPDAEWSNLSMGMTDDYPVAVEEGATLVRIGRAILGPRS